MKHLRCVSKGEGCGWLTLQKTYEVFQETSDYYIVYDDDTVETYVIKETMQESPEDTAYANSFELVEESPAISDAYEEEEFKRIEKNIQSEETLCDVALAYQLSKIQKYIREYGSNIELVVHKDFIAVNDEHCREYRGNVEQVIRFIKASGELAKVSDEMDRRN